MHRTLAGLLAALALVLATLAATPAWAEPIEDYADYQPQSKCSPRVKAGTKVLVRWLERRYDGHVGTMSRRCRSGGTSEHKEGRALDWSLDATKRQDRRTARAFMDFLFAEDKHGNTDAKARRMGVMYLIWNDRMWSAWDEFRPHDYLSSGCKKKSRCSKTLRHRDHVHVSLSRKGGFGRTSWYDGRVKR